jgi:AhpD family alkylhydroperoxidase
MKEAVAASVSILNQCSFCVDAHTVMLNSTGNHAIADAIGKARYERISDSEIRAIVDWALATRSPGSKILQSPPFSLEEAPEIIGTAVFYHYINRMATIFLSGTPLPSNNALLKDPLKRVAGLMFQKSVRRAKTPGESLGFLPPAELPEDMGWARGNPIVAQAFARFARANQDLGETLLSREARAFIFDAVEGWSGEEMRTRSRIEAQIGQFRDAEKGAVLLALLAALAPHQIFEKDILDFRKCFPYVTSLLGTAAWASFLAAKKIGSWIQFPASVSWD